MLRAKERTEQELREAQQELSETRGVSPPRARPEPGKTFEEQFKPLCQDLVQLRKDLSSRDASLAETTRAKNALEIQVCPVADTACCPCSCAQCFSVQGG